MINVYDSDKYIQAAEVVEQRLSLFFTDKPRLDEIVRLGLEFIQAPDAENKLKLFSTSLALLSEEIVAAILSGGKEFRSGPVAFIWEKLKASGIVIPVMTYKNGIFADHQLVSYLLALHLKDNTFKNIFLSKSSIFRRYQGSVLAIEVEKDGSLQVGTAFVISHPTNRRKMILTCKHNVDPKENITIQKIRDEDGNQITDVEFMLCDDNDIAAAYIQSEIMDPFSIRPIGEILDNVFCMGFPNVPQSNLVLLGHNGEINGYSENYLEGNAVMMVSNQVNPGSSGSPIINDSGVCVGMITRHLEGKYPGGFSAKFSAAIPAQSLKDFLVQDLN